MQIGHDPRNDRSRSPEYALGGLYALLAGNTVIYIGLGNSRGGGIYQERGISRRLGAHVLSLAPEGCEKSYVLQPRWQAAGVTDIGTIGFPAGLSYLAPALEDFLIGELNPPENSTRRRRS